MSFVFGSQPGGHCGIYIESFLICKESQLLQSALCAFLGFYCWIVFVFNHTNSVVHRISSDLQEEPIASCKVHFVHSLAFILRLCWDEWNKVHPGHLFDLLDCWLQHDSILHAMRCIALQIVLQSMLCYTIYWMQYIVYCLLYNAIYFFANCARALLPFTSVLCILRVARG